MGVMVLKVSSNTDYISAATSIAGYLLSGNKVYIDVIGMGANYMCTKAFISVKSNLGAKGIKVYFAPDFVQLNVDDAVKTGIRWSVYIVKPKK